MPDTSVRFRHRFEPWRQQLSAWIALPRDAQDVVSGASSFAAPSSAELSVAAAARARALDAVVTQIDAMPASAVSGPPDPTPPSAGNVAQFETASEE
jgi:hypothetical protein